MRLTDVTPTLRFVLFAIALVWVRAASPASAQDRLFVGDGELGAFGRFGDRIGAAPGAVHGRFLAGGRYVVTGSEFDISPSIFDTRTGGLVPSPPGRVLAVDPLRPRVFAVEGSDVFVWDVQGQGRTPLVVVNQDSTGFLPANSAAYAAESDELFVWSRGLVTRLSVVDVGRAVEVRTLSLDNSFAMNWRVTPDGARIVVPYGLGHTVLYDGHTGAPLATRSSVGETPVYDARFDRWYFADSGALTAFDGNLSLLATVPLEVSSCPATIAVSLHTDRLYLVHPVGRAGSTGLRDPMRLPLTVFDTATGRATGPRDVTSAAGIPPNTMRCRTVPMSVLSAPGPPSNLQANVTGRDVSLSWTRVGDATEFVLDAGLAPGRSDLRFGIGSATSVTFSGVPPGTYYLRVLGTNAFGVSRRSNEVVVTVP